MYRMAQSRHPDDVTDLNDPTVDVSAMIAEVGVESVATVQAPTPRTRVQMRAATVELQDRDAAVMRWHLTAHAADAAVHASTCIML